MLKSKVKVTASAERVLPTRGETSTCGIQIIYVQNMAKLQRVRNILESLAFASFNTCTQLFHPTRVALATHFVLAF